MRELAHENGYHLAPGVIPVRGMELLGQWICDDPAFAISHTRSLPRIVDLAHKIIGPDLCDTGEAVVHYNPTNIYGDWHYDIPWNSADGGVIPCWRFAVYFQDYTKFSGALAVMPGSHLGNVDFFDPVIAHVIASQPGDVVIWNLRTMHQPNTTIPGLPHAPGRNAIIFDYAAPGVDVERYRAWRLPKRVAEGRA